MSMLHVFFAIIILSVVGIVFSVLPKKPETAYYRVVDGKVQKSTSAWGGSGEMIWTDVPTLADPGSKGGWNGKAVVVPEN